jgi:uncharacterized membrane protein
MYHALKFIHVFAVIIFMGNIITGLFWKRHADGTRDRALIAHTMRGLIRADRWFTVPGVVAITAAGIFAAIQAGLPLLRTGWIFWSIVAFSLSGIAFVWKVAPLQKQLLVLAERDADLDWRTYHAKSLQWEWWGLFATVMPLIAVVLMTVKPHL